MSDGARCHYCRRNPCICDEGGCVIPVDDLANAHERETQLRALLADARAALEEIRSYNDTTARRRGIATVPVMVFDAAIEPVFQKIDAALRVTGKETT